MNPTFIMINNKRAIKLTNNNDLSFCAIASLAKVGGATLPSGLKIPDGNWTIICNYVVENYENTDDINNYLKTPE